MIISIVKYVFMILAWGSFAIMTPNYYFAVYAFAVMSLMIEIYDIAQKNRTAKTWITASFVLSLNALAILVAIFIAWGIF